MVHLLSFAAFLGAAIATIAILRETIVPNLAKIQIALAGGQVVRIQPVPAMTFRPAAAMARRAPARSPMVATGWREAA